ncbi:hypothetical protein KEHDKFFH_19845 [Marinobacter maroccanus]|uniref:ParB-like N-terminal domain-containing protein n=1 Tax=Marinobacter maroccanus TaxID=2055143 RepID=A0A2S5Z4R8_9GAMM|nr:ParB/RepB/Spo0J family partition protein [Marinobacter maroccanus]PPI82389.1 hypothetical protein KEHDKFFH_19845 [Marinobacter maroccanus]
MEQQIKLNALTISEKNVRKVSAADIEDQQLIASIVSQGLLQNLIVVKSKKRGKYEVVGGGRRLAALQHLAENGDIEMDYPVRCVVKDQSDATEASMAENLKAAMHDADWFAAYMQLKDQGMSAEDIAKRFGHSVTDVRKLLKLGGVAPVILEAFRNRELDKKEVMAFTVSDDQEKQMAVFEEMKEGYGFTAWEIRSRLLPENVRSTEPMALFVGLEAYEKAGGSVASDLFQEVTYLNDPELLQSLAETKIEALVAEKKVEGWKWVEHAFGGFWSTRFASMRRVEPEIEVELPEALTARLAEIDSLLNALNEKPMAEWTEEDEKAHDRLTDEERDLQEQKENSRVFSVEQKAEAGVLILIDREGEPEYREGILKPEDADRDGQGEDEQGEVHAPKKPEESAALLSDLSAYSLQALQADLMDSPELCFDLLVFNMALQRVSQSFLRPCEISVQWAEFSPKDITETKAAEKIQKARDGLNLAWMNEESEAGMFRAFQSLTMPDKLAIQAFCVAQSLRSSGSVIAEVVKEQISFDLSSLWQPTKDNYFKRVKREKLLDILVELKGNELAAGMVNAKKRDLAELLDGLEESKGWLPPQMRSEPLEV